MPYRNDYLHDKYRSDSPRSKKTTRVRAKNSQTKNKKPHYILRKWILGTTIVIVLFLVFLWQPISSYYTIKSANPTMVKLAQDAKMTRKGELLFLRTSPELVDDSQLAEVCPDSQTNANGFIEQGCFVPDQADPTTGRIYIRKMPADLYNLEVTTAAYEMLHPAYISLTEQADDRTALNKIIDDNSEVLADSDLKAQIANFAKTEPGAKNLELFSILGTEYSGVSSDLVGYYNPYISDLSTVVSLNNQVTQLFQSDQNQLISLHGLISKTDANASTAYQDSLSWAYAGNQYEDDYNYNIYVQDLNLENSYIRKYNSLLDQYNVLVGEYNGQQFSPESQVTSTQQ